MHISIHKTAKAIVVAAAALAFAVPAALAGTPAVDDYFRQTTQSGPGVQVHPDDWFRTSTGGASLSADERYLNAVASRNTSSVVADDYFRDRQTTPVQRIIAQEQARGLAVDDYFRDGKPALSADERYLNAVASRQASTVRPSVSVDDWFRDGTPALSADERYLNTVASRQASTVRPSVSVDDWFRDGQVEAVPAAMAQSPSGGFHVGDALIGAGASLGLMLLAAMGIRQRREHQHLKSA